MPNSCKSDDLGYQYPVNPGISSDTRSSLGVLFVCLLFCHWLEGIITSVDVRETQSYVNRRLHIFPPSFCLCFSHVGYSFQLASALRYVFVAMSSRFITCMIMYCGFWSTEGSIRVTHVPILPVVLFPLESKQPKHYTFSSERSTVSSERSTLISVQQLVVEMATREGGICMATCG